jgi:Conserved TM helix
MPASGPIVQVQTWGDAVFASISNTIYTLLGALPLIIGAIVILAIGWILSNLGARLTKAALERTGADGMFVTHGADVYGNVSRQFRPSFVGAEVVRWLIRFVFLNAAANVLGLTQISQLLNQVVLWLPNLIVAAVILLVAPILARFVRGTIEVGAGQMGFTNASLLGRIAEVAIVALAVIVAINQIGIAANLVDALFVAVVGALALAFGLAFGLGGRDVAAQITQQWYESSQGAAQRVRDAQASGPAPAAAATATAGATPRQPARAPQSRPAFAAVERNEPTETGY